VLVELYPSTKKILVILSVIGLVNPTAMVLLEELGKLKTTTTAVI
jgi:hypothetical protein